MFSHSDNSRTELVSPSIAVAFGFACMFVFPAIPVGNTLGIDATVILTAALLLFRPRIIVGPSVLFILLVMVPLVQSTLASWISADAVAPSMMPRSVVSYFLAVLPFVSGNELVRSGRLREVLIGISFALPVHALIAIYQMITFEQGTLPLLELMRTNPGMAMSSETAALYAEFTRRPFGLFAEPSAMAACIGPWLVLIAGLVVADKHRWPALSVHRGILALALASGCFLMAVSQSGDAVITIAGMAVALGASFAAKEEVSASRGRSWASVAAMLGVIAATAVAVASSFSATGVDVRAESSWASRLSSFSFVSNALRHDGWTFLFGVGPGQSFPMIELSTRFARHLPPEVTAVWSVTGSFVAETGVFGLLCIGAIGFAAAVSIWQSAQRTFGIACGLVWLTGILIATSYTQQPAIWFFLAVLLNWTKQFGFREVAAVSGKSTDVLATR